MEDNALNQGSALSASANTSSAPPQAPAAAPAAQPRPAAPAPAAAPAAQPRPAAPAPAAAPAAQPRSAAPAPAAAPAGIPPVQKQIPADLKTGATPMAPRPQVAPKTQEAAPAEAHHHASAMADRMAAMKHIGLNDNVVEKLNLSPKYLTTKYVGALVVGCLFLGVLIGMFFGGGSSAPKSSQQLTIGYIVPNNEAKNKKRCGAVEPARGCVLYIQNSNRREMQAKDFYSLVEQMTGLKKYQIETANMSYSHKSIKPGYIGQFNVPGVK